MVAGDICLAYTHTHTICDVAQLERWLSLLTFPFSFFTPTSFELALAGDFVFSRGWFGCRLSHAFLVFGSVVVCPTPVVVSLVLFRVVWLLLSVLGPSAFV